MSLEQLQLYWVCCSTSCCHSNAVKLLKQCFADEEPLVLTHLRQLIDLEQAQQQGDVKSLRHRLDTMLAVVNGLETLGQREEMYSNLLYPTVQQVLPKELVLGFHSKLVTETNSILFAKTEDEAKESFIWELLIF